MALDVDPDTVALFGSETRVRTLAILSNSSMPLTGYRIAKISGDQPIKVYTVLRSLAESSLVGRRRVGRGRTVWTMVDPDLRRFFRRRVRISWEFDWNSEAARRAAATQALPTGVLDVDLTNFRSSARPTPKLRELKRSPRKDRILASAGLVTRLRRDRAVGVLLARKRGRRP